jgi:hypothetical protein
MEPTMIMKTTLAAAAIATAVATMPVTAADAAPPTIDFSITIGTPNGYFSFGNGGGFYPQPQSMSCWEAKHYLDGEFKHVHKIECNGTVYTFKVKKFNIGPWKTLKINSDNGTYWFV